MMEVMEKVFEKMFNKKLVEMKKTRAI